MVSVLGTGHFGTHFVFTVQLLLYSVFASAIKFRPMRLGMGFSRIPIPRPPPTRPMTMFPMNRHLKIPDWKVTSRPNIMPMPFSSRSIAPPQESYSWPLYVSHVLTHSETINPSNLASVNRLLSHPHFPSNISLSLDSLKSALNMNQESLVKAMVFKSISPSWEAPSDSSILFEENIKAKRCYSAMLYSNNVTKEQLKHYYKEVLACIEIFIGDKDYDSATALGRFMIESDQYDIDPKFLRQFALLVLEIRMRHAELSPRKQFYGELFYGLTKQAKISPYLYHVTIRLATSSGLQALNVGYIQNDLKLLILFFEERRLESTFYHALVRQYFKDMIDMEAYVSLDYFHPDFFGKFFEQSDLAMVILTRLNQKTLLNTGVLNFFLSVCEKFKHHMGSQTKKLVVELGEKLLLQVDLHHTTFKARMDLLSMLDSETHHPRQGFMNLAKESAYWEDFFMMNNLKLILRDLLSMSSETESEEYFWRFLMTHMNLVTEMRDEYLPFFDWLDQQPGTKEGGLEKLNQHSPHHVRLFIQLAKRTHKSINVALYEELILNGFEQANSFEVATEIYQGLSLLHDHRLNLIHQVLLRAFDQEFHTQKDKKKLVWYLYFMSGHLNSQPLTIRANVKVAYGSISKAFHPRLVGLAHLLTTLPYAEFKCLVTMAVVRQELQHLIEKDPLLLKNDSFIHLAMSLLDPQSNYVKDRPDLREYYRKKLEPLAGFLLLNENE